MRVRVRKWGNSLAIRIPKPFAAEVQVGPGAAVDLSVRDGELVASPAARRYTLRVLLGRVRSDNVHDETDLGSAAGREVW